MATQPTTNLVSPSPQIQVRLPDQPASDPPITVRTIPDPRDSSSRLGLEKPPAAAARASKYLAGAAPTAWQVIALVVPVVLTGLITYIVSRSEARVTQQLDLQKQAFAQQIQLSEDLYRRRFETYDKLYAQLVILGNTLDHLSAGNSSVLWNRRLADSLAQLDTLRKLNRLHMSDSVYDAMGDAWQRGSRMNGAKFAQDLELVETRMQSELRNLMEREETRQRAQQTNP